MSTTKLLKVEWRISNNSLFVILLTKVGIKYKNKETLENYLTYGPFACLR